jgi:glycosyltransferase involved in cell wall biosynthesis
VDDGSTDLELEALFKLKETWPEIRIFHRPDNLVKGANSCRNYGLEKSIGEFVNFVDADDVLIADKIEKQITLFSRNSSLGMVVCKTRYFRNSLANQVELLQKLEFESDTDFLEYYLSKMAVWCTNSALIRKEALGPTRFKEGQIDAHEWLFFLSLLLNNVNVSAVNEVLVMKRIHQNTVGNINIRYKTPSLLEARKIIFSKIQNYRSPKRDYYLKLLLEDVNGLLRTSGKCGQFRLYFDTLIFFKLSFVKLVRGFALFFVFWILKKGTSFSVIS